MPLGQSFSPLDASMDTPRPTGAGASIQDAIKVLQLRLPRLLSQGAIAPAPLLTSPGLGGAPDPGNPLLNLLLRTLMPRNTPGAPPMPGIPPTPRVSPGQTKEGGTPAPISPESIGTVEPPPAPLPLPQKPQRRDPFPRRESKSIPEY